MKVKLRGNILLALISFLLTLALAEGFLRLTGSQPGFKTYSKKFKEVDSLYVLEGYDADSNGILRISNRAKEFVCNELHAKKSVNEIAPRSPHQHKGVYRVLSDFMQLRDESYASDFKSFLAKLSMDTTDEELITAIESYSICPFNSDGFKSIGFRKYNSKAKSILLLGDSFTWGHSASNITNCFADLLLAKGYVVYNSSITGTDPAQYLQIARALIPKLEPDFVVVNFYMGNDIVYFERKPLPHVPVFYCTNAGNLISCPEGIYFKDASEAYEHFLSKIKIPTGKNLFGTLCAKSVVGTLLWTALEEKGMLKPGMQANGKEYDVSKVPYYDKPYSNVQLAEIKAIAEQYKGTFMIAVIPAIVEGDSLLFPKDVAGLFDGLEYFVPPVTLQHYQKAVDGHYNDRGHAVHAAFIDSLCPIIRSRRFSTF